MSKTLRALRSRTLSIAGDHRSKMFYPVDNMFAVKTRAKTILERLHSIKNNSNFEIAALFTTYTARGKGWQFQNWNYF